MMAQPIFRGRDRFARHERRLNILTDMIRWMPMRLRRFLWSWAGSRDSMFAAGIRYASLCAMGGKLGRSVFVGPYVTIVNPQKLVIGDNVSIHRHCYLDASGGLSIGSDVSIAHQTSILTFEHDWSDKAHPIRDNPVRLSAVQIGDDVWIGAGVRILSGVRIGGRAVVAAGAVVTKAVEAGTVVGGVPARLLKRIA